MAQTQWPGPQRCLAAAKAGAHQLLARRSLSLNSIGGSCTKSCRRSHRPGERLSRGRPAVLPAQASKPYPAVQQTSVTSHDP